jgi:REP element-mobilizing transposase RayT/predicted transcriptional regulator
MARHLRVQFEGAVYHVTARGNAREKIFFIDRDYQKFLEKLSDAVFQYDIRLYLFCLMPNHFHLVLETPRANLSRFMQSLQTAYAVYFNLKHSFSGHLLQGRFGAKLVEKDRYFLKLCRYVDLNPVHVQALEKCDLNTKMRHLTEFRWSSFRSYVGLDAPLRFVDYDPLLALVRELMGSDGELVSRLRVTKSLTVPGGGEYGQQGQTMTDECRAIHRSSSDPECPAPQDKRGQTVTSDRQAAHSSPSDPRQAYRNFVMAGLAEDDEDLKAVLKGSPVAVGSTEFVRDMEKRYADLAQQAKVKEDVALRHCRDTIEPELVLATVAKTTSVSLNDLVQPRGDWEARALAAWLLVKRSKLSQRAVAQHLGLTMGSAVSHMLRALRERLTTDITLQEKLEHADRELAGSELAGSDDELVSRLRVTKSASDPAEHKGSQGQTVTDECQAIHHSPSDPKR